MLGNAYQIAGASFAGIVYSVSVVLGAVVVAMLIDGIRPNLNLTMAMMAMIGTAVWVMEALERAGLSNTVVK